MSAVTSIDTNRALKGIGHFSGPPSNTHFLKIVEIIKTALPLFADSALNNGIENENGLNRRLARFINNVVDNQQMPYTVQTESMEDEARGDSPAMDIGIHLKVEDIAIDPPKITVFEGKRLSTNLGSKRRREYVIGHEKDDKHVPCGGIERFKRSIHGGKFSHAGMIGYMQDETPKHWQNLINSWISDLSSQQGSPKWLEEEHLSPVTTDSRVSVSTSSVYRLNDELQLTHLWINLVV